MAKIPALDRPGPLLPWWMTAIATGQTTNARLPLSHLGALPRGAIAVSLTNYMADTASTTDADPGAGNLRWNHASQASATEVYLNDSDSDAGDHSGVWAGLGVGGHLYLYDPNDLDVWQWWSIDAVTAASGYVKLGVTLTDSAGSFGDDDLIVLTIQQPEASSGAVDSVNGHTGVVVLGASDVGAATAVQGAKADTAVQPGVLATIAVTGDVNDLVGFPGGTTKFLREDRTFAVPPGVGGSPGGANTQVQYNSAGAFAGDSTFTFDNTSKALGANIVNTTKGSDIARAATTNIWSATGNFVHLTGTTTITSFGANTAGYWRIVRFAGAGTLTHNASSLILPGGANITTAANDTAVVVGEGGSNARVVHYQRANGNAVVTPAATITGWASDLTASSPNSTTNVSRVLASGGSTNQDACVQPKGNGAFLLNLPDNTATGGNKRGLYAFDGQMVRSNAGDVAVGNYSVLLGAYSYAAADGAVAIGYGNTVNDQYGAAIGGTGNTAGYCAFATGVSSVAQGQYAFACGQGTEANGDNSWAGGYGCSTRGTYGAQAWGSGYFSSRGDCQDRNIHLRAATYDATQAHVTTNGGSATTTNQVILPNNADFVVKATVVVREDATGDSKSWDVTAHVRRGANAAATAMVAAATVTQIAAAAGASSWALAVDADTTNGGLRFRVTGQAARTLRWGVHVYSCNEVVG